MIASVLVAPIATVTPSASAAAKVAAVTVPLSDRPAAADGVVGTGEWQPLEFRLVHITSER